MRTETTPQTVPETLRALTVFVMSYMKFPVSANQSITGAIIGWGLFHANFKVFGRIGIAWVSSPTVAGLLTYLVAVATQGYFA